jgi:hypothetical protein
LAKRTRRQRNKVELCRTQKRRATLLPSVLPAGVYILETTPMGGGLSADVIWGKNMKGKEKKGDNVKEKGRKRKEKRRKGKENEKRGKRGKRNAK